MDAVSYPNPSVARRLSENFVYARVNVKNPDDETSTLLNDLNQVWTPLLVVFDKNGKEVRRSFGFLPPVELVPELTMGLGMYHLANSDFDKACECFEDVSMHHQNTAAAPEALYWLGVCAYKRDHNADGLTRHWKELKSRYPDSVWWSRASFIDK